jgi:hypothetical protein
VLPEVLTTELIEDLYPNLYVTTSADAYPKVEALFKGRSKWTSASPTFGV